MTRDLTDRGFRTFVEATNSIFWTTDGDGHPNSDSPSWRAFTGQSPEDWFGARAFDPVHPDDLPSVREAWARAKAEKRVFEAEFRLSRHDGVYRWMACRAVPLGVDSGSVREWFGVVGDISDRKVAEEERDRAVERWRTTLTSIGDAVMTTEWTS